MDSSNVSFMPPQKVSAKEKQEHWWKEANVMSVITTCYTYGMTRRSTPRDKARNYNLFNNKINDSDFKATLNPFNLKEDVLKDFTFPATLRPYDIVSPYFNLLLGEESKRPFNPMIRAVNEDALNEKQKRKKELILQELGDYVGNALQDKDQAEADLTKYQWYSPKLMIESVSEKFLNHYYKKENLDYLFNQCFKDALLAAEEIVDVTKVGDGVKVRRVNPMEIWYHLSTNSHIIDNAEMIYERNLMTLSEIVDEFYEYLTPDQIDDLEKYGYSGMSMFNSVDRPLAIPEVDSIYQFQDFSFNRGIAVHRGRWKSKKKLGIWSYIDEQGQPQEAVVEETFKKNPGDPTQKIEWFWINEYWEFVRLGEHMYLWDLIRPRAQQFRDIDNLSTCKSGYVGTVYSATNSQSTSLMDRVVPWVYLYLIIWYRTELAIAKNLGKIGQIDLSLIPDDWEPEKAMWYAQAFGFMFVNSYNESNKRHSNGSGFNMSTQNKELDLETGQYIKNHLELLNFIEERIQNTTGITRQRMGSIQTSELVGNTERAVMQSSYITEPYYALHENFKLRVCEAVIEVAKECFEGKTKNFEYITDDLASVLYQIEGAEFSNASYGVFVTNGSKDQKVLGALEQMLDRYMQSDKAQMSTIIDVLGSNSIADVRGKLLQTEKEWKEYEQNIQKQQQDANNEGIQMQMQDKQAQRDWQADQNQLDRENNIEVAAMKAEGSDALGSPKDDSKQIMDMEKIQLERSKLEHQKVIDHKKLGLEAQKIVAEHERTNAQEAMNRNHERELKDKDQKGKEKLEKIKQETAVKVARLKPRPTKKK